MTIKQQYQKAYRNYLRRVNRQIRQGFIVEIIPKVKRPTRASISRLEKQSAKEIRRKASIVDLLTGEVIEKPTKVQQDTISKANREFNKLSPEYQQAAFEMGTIDTEQLTKALEPSLKPLNAVDHIIDVWYAELERIRPPEVSQYLINKTNEILLDASREKMARFAWTIDNNPGIIGEYNYLDKKAIDLAFDKLRQAMNWAVDSEDYQEFKELIEYYEEE